MSRHCTVRRLLPFAALAAVALVSRTASADAATDCRRGDCEYRFDDEGVSGPGRDAYSDWVKLRHRAPVVRLIRPRVSFVMELLKTVQTL